MDVQTNRAICLEAFSNEVVFDESLSKEESEEIIRIAASILVGAICENKKNLKSRVQLLQRAYIAMEKLLMDQQEEKEKSKDSQ